MALVGGPVHSFLPRSLWGGARGEDGEFVHQMPGVNAPVDLPAPMTAGQSIADFNAAVALEGRNATEADIEGALDRQLAQRELGKKLQVIGKNHAGPRAPNQVTQAELEQLARTAISGSAAAISPSTPPAPTIRRNTPPT